MENNIKMELPAAYREHVAVVCEKMARSISLIKELNYRLERQDMADEVKMLREQARCCYYVLAAAQNTLEMGHYQDNDLKPEPFCISDVIDDLLGEVRSKIRANGCGIGIEPEIEPDVICLADPERFAACFMNLLVNSLQNVDFEEGSVRVILKVYENAGVASVTVLDDGYAMSPATLEERRSDRGAHGFDVLREFSRSVGTEPNFSTKEYEGFGVTVKVPLAPADGDTLTFESNERGACIESFSPGALLMYKLDWIRVVL